MTDGVDLPSDKGLAFSLSKVGHWQKVVQMSSQQNFILQIGLTMYDK